MTGEHAATIEILYVDGCPSYATLVPHLQELLDQEGATTPIVQIRIDNDDDAQTHRFLGSPSVRVVGQDVDPGAGDRDDFGMKCRLYATPDGLHGTPPDAWVLAALAEARPR